LVAAGDAEEATMITHHRPAKLWNIIFEVNEVFRLLVCCYVVKMNVFVAPFEIMNYPFISKFFLDNKCILKEVNDSFLDIEMVELRNHCLLVFKISLILVNQRISFINYISNIIENSTICAYIKC
jgi:hypothetical protein